MPRVYLITSSCFRELTQIVCACVAQPWIRAATVLRTRSASNDGTVAGMDRGFVLDKQGVRSCRARVSSPHFSFGCLRTSSAPAAAISAAEQHQQPAPHIRHASATAVAYDYENAKMIPEDVRQAFWCAYAANRSCGGE